MMKRLVLSLTLALLATGCTYISRTADRLGHGANPYAEDPYWLRYTYTGSETDRRIHETLGALRANPTSAPLHNDLGALLMEKRLPRDAEREFRRALDADPRFFPAAYNIALVRLSRNDVPGTRRALRRTLHLKPGHPLALFDMGLLLERTGKRDAAVDYYARAIEINKSVLDVKVNPRVLDSRLIDRALLKLYPTEHARRSAALEATPAGYVGAARQTPNAPSRQAEPSEIVTPSAPVTDQGTQTPPPPIDPLLQ